MHDSQNGLFIALLVCSETMESAEGFGGGNNDPSSGGRDLGRIIRHYSGETPHDNVN